MDTKINSRIWADLEFIELNDSEKLCVFWVLTNVNSCGYVAVSDRRLTRDIEANVETLKKAVKMFKGEVEVFGDGVWLRRYIGEQMGIGAKLVKNKMSGTVIKHIEDQCPAEVRRRIYQSYPELEELRPKGDSKGEGEGDGKGDSKGDSKGAGVLGRSEEMERDIDTEMEVRFAHVIQPTASHYLDGA